MFICGVYIAWIKMSIFWILRTHVLGEEVAILLWPTDLTWLQAKFLDWFQDDLQINQGYHTVRNDPGLQGFNLIYQLWVPYWNTYYWDRDEFVNIDGVSCVYSIWADINKHMLITYIRTALSTMMRIKWIICYHSFTLSAIFVHSLPHTFLTVMLSLSFFVSYTLLFHSFLHSLAHSLALNSHIHSL